MNQEEFIKEYERALATQKWEQVEPFIHPDCIVTFTTGTHKGKSAVEKAFRANFESIKDEKYSISNIHWALKSNQFSVFVYNFHWSGIVAGKHVSGSGRGTSSLVNINGDWLLVAEHLGPNV
ncbi:MAG TPA: nuclear transport factor 2 family protein [Anaerolineae bacterium]|nr:nuclear transport factor 2 family protein [Anaerolineae bacterium]HIP69933.1 nuclear transport factor 2 family protein [Anaerolineae bacterium]